MTCNSPFRLFPNEAVFQARGMLSAIDPGLVWDDATACTMAEPRYRKAADPMISSMSVWPNPTRHTLSIDLSEGTPQVWDITLYNAYGVPVRSWRYPSGFHQLDLTDMPSGVYTLQATGVDGQRLNSRIFIAQ